ncbi:MAG: cell division protein FtsZ [Treponema sp.]|nr:cell division protein FtsZ [Candidatus Treponema equi]
MEFTNVQDTLSSQGNTVAPNGLLATAQSVAVPSAAVNAASQDASGELNFDDELNTVNPTKIKIIGCGGGGSSAVQRMIDDGVSGVEFIVLNTDKQALFKSKAKLRVPIGQKITGGLGAGGNPKVGEEAAIEDTERLKLVLNGANMVVITAGMGGGTGTGSAPVVAQLAHDAGILTIAVVTTPFEFEGTVRMNNAMEGLAKLRSNVDSLIVLPNDKIFKAMKPAGDRKLTFREQFVLADNLLCAGVKGVTEIITKPGDVNVDFADVCSIMRGSGESILGVGKGKGENRINEAVEGAIFNPLLENRQIDGAKKILINITTNGNISLEETQEIADLIRHSADKNANIIFGLATNENMEDDDLAVTVIATEFDAVDNDFVSVAEVEQMEDKDDTVVSMEDFHNIINGGIKTEPVVEEKPQFSQPEPRVSTIGRNSIFDTFGSFEEPAKTAEPVKTEPVIEEKTSVFASKDSDPIKLDESTPKFTVKDPAPGTDLDDGSVPAFYRNRMKNLNRSIDLTSI